LYQNLLAEDERSADGQHLLGVLHDQQGDRARALEEIGWAVALRPNVLVFLAKPREVVRLQPNLAPAHDFLGNALRALGRLIDARAAYQEAIRLDANLAKSYAQLRLALQQDGDLGETLTRARFHETARPVRTASVMQVRQPLYRRALARWKHYEGTLADLFARLPLD
jgi:tetratricopeptide (TPR) repeat protein